MLGQILHAAQYFSHSFGIDRLQPLYELFEYTSSFEQVILTDVCNEFMQSLLDGGIRESEPFNDNGNEHRVYVHLENALRGDVEVEQVCDQFQDALEEACLQTDQILHLAEDLHGDQVGVGQCFLRLNGQRILEHFDALVVLLEVIVESQ